jgi:hypothetical protein
MGGIEAGTSRGCRMKRVTRASTRIIGMSRLDSDNRLGIAGENVITSTPRMGAVGRQTSARCRSLAGVARVTASKTKSPELDRVHEFVRQSVVLVPKAYRDICF